MKTNVLYFEGLSPLLIVPFGASYIKNGLIKKLKGNFTPIRYAWFEDGPEVVPEGKLIVVAHSMGTNTALKWMKNHDREVALFVSLDGRPLGLPYIKPNCVARAFGFYRTSWWMRGNPVQGAMNAVVTCSHGAVPALPIVREIVQGEIDSWPTN